MKFCKSLQRVASISDPSYAPYWTNYKLLKKLIKAISAREAASVSTSMSDPSLDFSQLRGKDDYANSPYSLPLSPRYRVSTNAVKSAPPSAAATAASTRRSTPTGAQKRERPGSAATEHERDEESDDDMSTLVLDDDIVRHNHGIEGNPREVAFFGLLHAEVRKAIDFFDKVERECIVREQVVSVGMEILKKPRASMVHDRWSVISRAIFFLYRDLLLLETFAIMTYFSFSKILKKHDKVTGFSTRDSFMINVVNKANFTNYPKILELIGRCQTLYNEASEKLVQDLYEDERLFLNMVSEWNAQNRESGGPRSNQAEVTEGLRSETVRGVSQRSRESRLRQRELPTAASRQPLKKRRRSTDSST